MSGTTPLKDFISLSVPKMRAAGIENPRFEMRVLISNILGARDADIIAGDIALNEAQRQSLEKALKRRLSHEPLSKIIGRRSFWKHDFIVNENVLDPRADTEILVEEALKWAQRFQQQSGKKEIRILDLGTGSGCIILSLLSELKDARGIAVDISREALDVARKNAEHLSLGSRVEFYQGRWIEPLIKAEEDGFDLVVSNPPYISTSEMESLERNVLEFDPILALEADENGLCHYEEILKLLPQVILPHTSIFFEHGANQRGILAESVVRHGFEIDSVYDDYAGKNRVVSLSREKLLKK